MPKLAPTPPKSETTKSNPKKNGKDKADKKAPDTPIVYPDYGAKLCIGDQAITFDVAKEMIGWQEVTDDNYHLTYDDAEGKTIRVRLNHNSRNRQYDKGLARKWESEHLQHNWEMNGEPLIIGNHGNVMSGQHRLAGFILAVIEWRKDPDKWPRWKSEPVYETFLNLGIDECDRVANTLDTAKPRSFADAVYRSNIFKEMKDAQRAKCSKLLMHCVNMLWSRVGAKLDAFSPDRTHADSFDFVSRHTKTVECVKHIQIEDGTKGNISAHYVSGGYAAALCYMMGCSATEPEKYRMSKPPTEEQLTWGNLNRAFEFMVLLAQGHKSLAAVREVTGNVLNSVEDNYLEVRMTVLIKAWLLFVAGKKITADEIRPEFGENDDKVRIHINEPTCGGIDLGNPKRKQLEEDEPADDPTPEQIAERSAEIQTEKNGKKGKKKTDKRWAAGDDCWVSEDGGFWHGTVSEIYSTQAGLVAKVKADDGKEWEAPIDNLTEKGPEA